MLILIISLEMDNINEKSRNFVANASIVKNTMTAYTLFVVLIAMMIVLPLFYTNNGLFAILTNLGHLQQPIFMYAVGN